MLQNRVFNLFEAKPCKKMAKTLKWNPIFPRSPRNRKITFNHVSFF